MKSVSALIQLALVCVVALVASGCERSVAGACTSAQDAAAQVSRLTDDLNAANRSGTLASSQVGAMGARILAAGKRFGIAGNHQSYCTAIEKIRSDALLP